MTKLNKKVFIRKQIVSILTISFYILTIYYFFINPYILLGLLFSILFFMVFHYFIIEIGDKNILTLIFSLVFIVLFLLFFSFKILNISNIFYIIAFVFFHISILFLVFHIQEEVYNKLELNFWSIFISGARNYSLFLALIFALTFIGVYRTFNLTCSKIYTFSHKLATIVPHYLGFDIPVLQDDVNVKDIVSKFGTGVFNQQLTGITLSSLVDLNFWKYVIVKQIMDNKKILDKNICEIIVSNIKEKYSKPGFQFTVIFLIFMLFYPLIRVVIFVLAIINWILFQLAHAARIYRLKKVVEEVEILE